MLGRDAGSRMCLGAPVRYGLSTEIEPLYHLRTGCVKAHRLSNAGMVYGTWSSIAL